MIRYNPKEWFAFIFKFHRSDTIRQLFPLIIAIGLYSAGVAYLEINYWKLPENSYAKNIPLMHGLLSFVISMLLVFRTNTAYDRWWEGRKMWGALVNNSRNLAIKMAAILPKDAKEQRLFFKKMIPAYAYALKNHLNHESTRLELFDDEDDHLRQQISHEKHVPNQVAMLMMQRVNKLYEEGLVKGEQLIILNNELQSFTDICGACERIKNTPIPFSYSAFLKKFIFFYVITLPFGYVFSLGYLVIPVVCFIFYVLASLELIAEEIEEPFGGDANDLPTEKIARAIHKNIYEIL
jgi:ion channel-forming bestrophin family protein